MLLPLPVFALARLSVSLLPQASLPAAELRTAHRADAGLGPIGP